MADSYINRSLEPVLRRAAREFPVVVLTGPRQSGKTTLLRHLFDCTHRYVSLEPPDVRAAAAADPRGFLDIYRSPVIFDEIQYAPDLLSYIKEEVDNDRERAGQYLLTGSQNLLLTASVTETLAGRVAMLRLLPMSRSEAQGQPRRPLIWERRRRENPTRVSVQRIWQSFLRGGYPELIAHPRRDHVMWHAGYIQTYLERDVRSLRQLGDLTLFQSFLRAMAARSGQLFNMTDLARDLGVAVNTIRAWLSLLEATFQVVVLRPYFANIGKRLVKRPKIYFTDTGLLCSLVGLKDPDHTATGPMNGVVFETAVLSEILRVLVHRGGKEQVYFWRTSTGIEVDFVVETEGQLIPIEVKCSATPRPAMGEGVRRFREDLGDKVGQGYVVHTGAIRLPLAPGVTAIPFTDL